MLPTTTVPGNRITRSTMLTGVPGFNVLDISGLSLRDGQILRLDGPPGTQWVINDSGDWIVDNATIALGPNLSSADVVFNITRPTAKVVTGAGSLAEGVVLFPNTKGSSFDLAPLSGSIIGGYNDVITPRSSFDVFAPFNWTNVAVAATTASTGALSATDQATVVVGSSGSPTGPSIKVVKNPKSQTVAVGGTATFKITVTNTGDVALTDVTVVDQKSPRCSRTIGALAPGQSVSYSCTKPNVTAGFTNVIIATGTPPSGPKVTSSDTAPVTVAALKPPKKPHKKPKIVSHHKPRATG